VNVPDARGGQYQAPSVTYQRRKPRHRTQTAAGSLRLARGGLLEQPGWALGDTPPLLFVVRPKVAREQLAWMGSELARSSDCTGTSATRCHEADVKAASSTITHANGQTRVCGDPKGGLTESDETELP
jgi:hypothetical protein